MIKAEEQKAFRMLSDDYGWCVPSGGCSPCRGRRAAVTAVYHTVPQLQGWYQMPGEGGGHMFRASHNTHLHAANSIRLTELELNC